MPCLAHTPGAAARQRQQNHAACQRRGSTSPSAVLAAPKQSGRNARHIPARLGCVHQQPQARHPAAAQSANDSTSTLSVWVNVRMAASLPGNR